jgi:type I restriction enzyme S subunit
MLIPSNGLAATFGTIVGVFYEKAETNKQESRILAALRDTLLPNLISGDLRVDRCESDRN